VRSCDTTAKRDTEAVDALLETVNKPRHSAKKPGTGGWHVRCTFHGRNRDRFAR
jgi:hypothetical protein